MPAHFHMHGPYLVLVHCHGPCLGHLFTGRIQSPKSGNVHGNEVHKEISWCFLSNQHKVSGASYVHAQKFGLRQGHLVHAELSETRMLSSQKLGFLKRMSE